MVPNKLALSKVADYTWYMHASKLEMPTAMQYDSNKQVITCPLGFPLGPFSMKSDRFCNSSSYYIVYYTMSMDT